MHAPRYWVSACEGHSSFTVRLRQETTVLIKDYELPDGRTIKVGAERCGPHHPLRRCTHRAVWPFALGRRRNAAPLICVDEICHNQVCKRE